MKKLYEFIRKNYFYFIFYSVVGWIYELFFFLFRGELVNRGFLTGPYLPIYGIGSLFIIYLLNKLKDKKICLKKINLMPVIIFLLIFIITTIVEYIGHFILDEYFNIILWDYSQDYWNINGRVCFYASRNFAIMGIIGIYLVHPKLERFINNLSDKIKNILFIFFGSTFLIDFLFTIIKYLDW